MTNDLLFDYFNPQLQQWLGSLEQEQRSNVAARLTDLYVTEILIFLEENLSPTQLESFEADLTAYEAEKAADEGHQIEQLNDLLEPYLHFIPSAHTRLHARFEALTDQLIKAGSHV